MSHPALEVLTGAPVPFAEDGALLMKTYEAMLARIKPHTQSSVSPEKVPTIRLRFEESTVNRPGLRSQRTYC
jgi:hypothetical protein